MRKLPTLVRVALRVNFGLSVLRPREILKKKKDLWMAPLILLGLAGLVPILILYVKLLGQFFVWLQPLGQSSAILTFAILIGQFLILVFGFYYVLSAFYFSRDLPLLVPLPLTPTEILLSKFSVLLVNEYLTVAPLVLPAFIVYGIRSRGGLFYWLQALAVYLLLPVIPLTIVALLVMGMMRIVNFGRKKDALIIVGSLLLLTLALAFQYRVGNTRNINVDREAAIRFLAAPDGLVQQIGAKFPPSIWASRSLGHGLSAPGPANALLFLGVSLALFLGVVAAARTLFYRGLIGLSEQSSRRKALSRTTLERRVAGGRHPVRAIFRREFRIMNRTPIFLLNGILSAVLIPIVFSLMGSMGGQSSDARSIALLFRSANPQTIILVAAAMMTICGTLNGTASSTFSREGAQFWMSKVIPVAARVQIKGKLLHSLGVAGLGLAAAAVVCAAVFRVPAASLILALALAVPAAFLLTIISMTIDLARPLLKWTNPQKAIKQNFNVLLAFFADLGVLVLVYFAIRGLGRVGIAGHSLYAVLLIVLAALGALAYVLLGRFADKRYREIEV